MTRVYIGLGSNLDNPLAQLKNAVRDLKQLPHTTLTGLSSLYQSKPVGPQNQPDYLNAVVALDTELAPLNLLDALQAIETKQGRVRQEHWGARTLDLDILLFGDQIIHHARLIVPHPYLTQRSFVLMPLADINPDLQLPDGQWLVDLVKLCPPEGLTRLADSIEDA
jgi:2-amino-4-hydroxy-6-hydroxymethyldihydropteridine diphosphokinase